MNKNFFKLPKLSLQLFLRYGLCLLMLVAPFFRGLYFESHFLPFVIGISILFVIYLYHQYKQRESGFFDHPLDWALLALLVAYLFSLFTAVNTRAAVGGLMKYVVYFMIFWMCCWTARQEKGRSLLLWSFYLAGAGMALVGILIYSGMINYQYLQAGGRISGILEYANTFGAYMAVLSIIGWSLIISNQRLITRAALAGSNALIVMAMLGSLSRGTWVLYPFAFLAFIVLVGKGKRLEACAEWLVFFVTGLIMGRWLMIAPQLSESTKYLVLGFILAAGAQIGLDYLIKFMGTKLEISGRRLRLGLLAGALLIISVSIFSYTNWNSYFTQGSVTRLTNITLQDENVQLRFEFNRDAFKIIKDHPLTGIGSGGWEDFYHHYASHLYWSDKTHNYFLQTWVETGTLGFIALIAVWGAFIFMLWTYLKKPKEEKGVQNMTLFWGGAVAILLLGAHSSIDFNMSYPAVAILLFGLMGVLHGMFWEPSVLPDNNLKARKKARHKQQELLLKWKNRDLIVLFSGIICAVILVFSAGFFWSASLHFQDAQKIVNQDPNGAVGHMNSALRLDSLNADYWVEYAKFMAFVAASSPNQAAYNQALAAGDKAFSLRPYNINILNSINTAYAYVGQYEKNLQIAEAMIWANPLDPAVYENLSSSQVLAGISQLEANNLPKAQSYWKDSLNVINRVPQGIETPAVGLFYTSGQANLLLGNREQGEKWLQDMLIASGKDSKGVIIAERNQQLNSIKVQARIWLTASMQITGRETEAQKIFAKIPTTDQELSKKTLESVTTWLQKTNPNP